MAFNKPVITALGKEMGIRTLFGNGAIEFYAVQIGSGYNSENPESTTELVNLEMNATILGYSDQGDSIILNFTFDNAELEEGFSWSEYGVMAKFTSGDGQTILEGLYCYGYDDSETPEVVPKFTGSNSYYKARFSLAIAVGNAENVTVNLGEYSDYVQKVDFDDHTNNKENPHEVTKAQVGLGNVENVSVNSARPTFTAPTTLSSIVSGETTTSLWGKVKLAIDQFINHKADETNPHKVTRAQLGAAAASHTHDASNITTGTLPVSRGGTNATTVAAARTNLGLGNVLGYLPSAIVVREKTYSKSIGAGIGETIENCSVDVISGYTLLCAIPTYMYDANGDNDDLHVYNLGFSNDQRTKLSIWVKNCSSRTARATVGITFFYIRNTY